MEHLVTKELLNRIEKIVNKEVKDYMEKENLDTTDKNKRDNIHDSVLNNFLHKIEDGLKRIVY